MTYVLKGYSLWRLMPEHLDRRHSHGASNCVLWRSSRQPSADPTTAMVADTVDDLAVKPVIVPELYLAAALISDVVYSCSYV